MSCIADETLMNDLVNWSMTSAMGGQYSGSVQLMNASGQYDESLHWTPLRIYLAATAVGSGGVDVSGLWGTTHWINGLISSVREGEGLSAGQVSLSIVSYFTRLGRKPVNTEFFNALSRGDYFASGNSNSSYAEGGYYLQDGGGYARAGSTLTELAGTWTIEDTDGKKWTRVGSVTGTYTAAGGGATGSLTVEGTLNVGDILAELASRYGTTPPWLYDFSELASDDHLIRGVVTGNNLLAEMQAVAEAGESDLFVQADGILTAGLWKDASDSVDFVIPAEAVIEANISHEQDFGPSILKVSGRFFSEYECGDQQMICGGGGGGKPGGSGSGLPARRPTRGEQKICAKVGIAEPDARARLQGIKVGAQSGNVDGANFEITDGDGDYESGDEATITVRQGSDGEIEMVPTTQGFLAAGDHSVTLGARGRAKPPESIDGPGAKKKLGAEKAKAVEKQLKAMVKKLTKGKKAAVGGAGGGAGGGGSGTSGGGANAGTSADKANDEKDPNRIEMIVTDPDLQNEFGTVVESIDNLYISDKETLFDVAVHRFQEFKRQRKVWTVKCTHIDTLRLNQVVQFRTPKQNTLVTGLLSQIAGGYNPEPTAQMTLLVESFEDIGATEYTSDNLLLCGEFEGVNEIGQGTVWVCDDDERIWAADGYMVVEGAGIVYQWINVDVNATYDVEVFGFKPGGGGGVATLSFGGSSTNCLSNSTTSITGITPASSPAQFKLDVTSGQWEFKKPRLVKHITA